MNFTKVFTKQWPLSLGSSGAKNGGNGGLERRGALQSKGPLWARNERDSRKGWGFCDKKEVDSKNFKSSDDDLFINWNGARGSVSC